MSKKCTTEEFIEKARKIHGDKYDYSKVEYVNNHTKITIVCRSCGNVFRQKPYKHLQKQGCAVCACNKRKTTEECIKDFKEIHGDRYLYDKVKYESNSKEVIITCKIHGDFLQTPRIHLLGCNCPKCAKKESIKKIAKKLSSTTEEFIQKANKIHNFIYDYSLVKYINANIPVTIICSKHGKFSQTPHDHLAGKGCKICRFSKLEKTIEAFLNENNIKFFPQCDKNTFEWLGRQSLDFYLPDYNVAIECQGIQHFEAVEYFGGEEKLKIIQKLDVKKHKLCEEHNIKILYFSYEKFNNNNTIIDTCKLLAEIKNDEDKRFQKKTISKTFQ